MSAEPSAISPTVVPVEHAEPSPTEPTPCKKTKTEVRIVKGKKYEIPIDKPLYVPHGKWAWTDNHDFISGDPGCRLGSGLEGHVNLKLALIDEKKVVYVSKLTSVWDNWKMFFSSLYLNAATKYLRPLQGDCVPWIIGVRHCGGGRLGVAQDLPHPTGWREADMFLTEPQKEAIIAAYKKLHDRGILHGDVEYRHMLIGDDGKVTLIDFGFSKVVNPDEMAQKAGLDACSFRCLRNEMRKVKFLLDWKDSRATEFRLAKLRNIREEKDNQVADALMKAKTDPYERIDCPKMPMFEEEKAAPDGALRLCDLEAWSYGNTWTAHRYEVICHPYRAEIVKTDVSRPPNPIKTGKEELAITPPGKEPSLPIASTPTVPGAPSHTVIRTSDVSAGTIDAPTPASTSSGKRSLEEEEEVHVRSRRGASTVVQNLRERDEGDKPATKRRRTSETSATSSTGSSMGPPLTPLLRVQSPSPRDHPSHIKPANSNTPNETDFVQELLNGKGDPTPFELTDDQWASLRRETTRSFSRLSAANLRVHPMRKKLDEETHKLEKCRSQLLRLLLMMPVEDRTTMWTNMGQPDARDLLGIRPERRVPHVDVEEVEGSATSSTPPSSPSSAVPRHPTPSPSDTVPRTRGGMRMDGKERLLERAERLKREKAIMLHRLLPHRFPPVKALPQEASTSEVRITAIAPSNWGLGNPKGSVTATASFEKLPLMSDSGPRVLPYVGPAPATPSVLSAVGLTGNPFYGPPAFASGSHTGPSNAMASSITSTKSARDGMSSKEHSATPGLLAEPLAKRKREMEEERNSSTVAVGENSDTKRRKVQDSKSIWSIFGAKAKPPA